jgi:hypothetical protein
MGRTQMIAKIAVNATFENDYEDAFVFKTPFKLPFLLILNLSFASADVRNFMGVFRNANDAVIKAATIIIHLQQNCGRVALLLNDTKYLRIEDVAIECVSKYSVDSFHGVVTYSEIFETSNLTLNINVSYRIRAVGLSL